MSLNPLVDSRDVRFVLFEMLGLDKISRFEHFAGLDRDVFEDTLSLAEKIAMAHFYSTNAEGDKVGLTYDPKTAEVHVPDFLRPGYNAFIEAGFHNLKLPVEEGGMGLPITLSFSSSEYFNAGNTALGMYCSSLTGTLGILIN